MNIRKATLEDAKAIASVHVESWKTTYKGIVPSAYLQELKVAEKEELWKRILQQDHHHIFVAEEYGTVCGFISGGNNRVKEGTLAEYEGELYAIYLLKEAQRKGYGKKLVSAFIKDLWNDGIRSLIVWVLNDNPSKHFYERLGAAVVGEETIEIGGKALKEICYGWKELEQLL
ncbi:GNAT family N-acetyltransferase [Anoxybacteroides tepidamans]|uniref:GNAT family N-acetyltransferase n=1 Tax=Anoxybacteroides tepidamans TaxID=265948 RepID=UPI000489870C|nr:GNAT family N-acetyltransferase [Anoxybacillus tepidamans]